MKRDRLPHKSITSQLAMDNIDLTTQTTGESSAVTTLGIIGNLSDRATTHRPAQDTVPETADFTKYMLKIGKRLPPAPILTLEDVLSNSPLWKGAVSQSRVGYQSKNVVGKCEECSLWCKNVRR